METVELYENDKIVIDNIERLVCKDNAGKLYINNNNQRSWEKTYLDGLETPIQRVIKFIPNVSYDGGSVDIEAYIKDEDDVIVYLETVGQDSNNKSVLSVFMQGRVEQNKKVIRSNKLGIFKINKRGNKRVISMLEDNISNAILFHSPSIKDDGFNILIGRNEEELLETFAAWLVKSQPLPFPKEKLKLIYEELLERELITFLDSFNMKAAKISDLVYENEFVLLQEVIIDICIRENLVYKSNTELENENTSYSDNIFGEVISSYTRAEAIADGFLIDINNLAKECGIVFHTVMTPKVLEMVEDKPDYEDYEGRVWDIVNMLKFAISRKKNNNSEIDSEQENEILFPLILNNKSRTRSEIKLKAIVGPGDNAEPVITIFAQHEAI